MVRQIWAERRCRDGRESPVAMTLGEVLATIEKFSKHSCASP